MASTTRQSKGSRSVRSRYTPRDIEAKLVRYLNGGKGHAVLVGEDQYALHQSLDAAIVRARGVRVIAFSGRLGRIDVMAELMASSMSTRSAVGGKEQVEAMFSEMADARTRGVSLVVVVEDADFASVQSLEALCTACDTFASSIIEVRIMLLGGHFLTHLLTQPRLRTLAGRVGSQFNF